MRPLSVTMLEQNLPVNVSHEPPEVALRLLGDILNSETPLDVAKTRYRECSDSSEEPLCVPLHPMIVNQILRPLIEAKHCYILGMPVACIAQAGLVGEMVALWRFRMQAEILTPEEVDEEIREALQGDAFDRMGQESRVKILRKLESLDELTVQAFGELRGIRRRYLHFMLDDKLNPDKDARMALKWANALIVKTLDLKSDSEGRLVLPDNVRRFIKDIIVTPPSP
jgi:hypothetical protein